MKVELDLTKDEWTVLMYMLFNDHGDPLKDIYECGEDKPEDPYGALTSVQKKISQVRAK